MMPFQLEPIALVFAAGVVTSFAFNPWFAVFLSPAFMLIGFVWGMDRDLGPALPPVAAVLTCWIGLCGYMLQYAAKFSWAEFKQHVMHHGQA